MNIDASNPIEIGCFKAYDVRGRLPDELNENVAYRIARGYADFTGAKTVALGRDVRLSSPAISDAVAAGLIDAGIEVVDIGLCGTEEIYFRTFSKRLDGGIMVTASHNPPEYNGLKMVREMAHPLSADTGLEQIRALAEGGFALASAPGRRTQHLNKREYLSHLLGYISVERLQPLRIVVNPGNGCAGPIIRQLQTHLPFDFVEIDFEPDGTFPNGVPNPMLPENQEQTSEKVKSAKADFGVAWDGDFDRCFLYDEKGRFIDGYYVVGLLAKSFLAKHPGSKILHDPRLVWNTLDIVKTNGGQAIQSKSGHAFMKEVMRHEDCVYGGEMSAHHYFRDFGYCDSGMIPWLLVAELISETGMCLSEMVAERQAMYPISGEINRKVVDPVHLMRRVESLYKDQAQSIEHVDGLSMEFPAWRFNLRPSNTEPLLRLNVESRADRRLMETETAKLLSLIEEGAD